MKPVCERERNLSFVYTTTYRSHCTTLHQSSHHGDLASIHITHRGGWCNGAISRRRCKRATCVRTKSRIWKFIDWA